MFLYKYHSYTVLNTQRYSIMIFFDYFEICKKWIFIWKVENTVLGIMYGTHYPINGRLVLYLTLTTLPATFWKKIRLVTPLAQNANQTMSRSRRKGRRRATFGSSAPQIEQHYLLTCSHQVWNAPYHRRQFSYTNPHSLVVDVRSIM